MMHICQGLYSLILLVVKTEYFSIFHGKILADVLELTVVKNERILIIVII